MKNPVVHFEIQSQDPAALRAFYADLFDWNVQHHEAIDYGVVTFALFADPRGTASAWRPARSPTDRIRGCPGTAYPCVASRYSLVSDSPWMRMAVDAVWSFASYGQK